MVFTVYSNINQYMNPARPTQTQTKQRDIAVADPSAVAAEREEEDSNMISEDSDHHGKKTVVNTNIISASINGQQHLELEKPVEFTLQHLDVSTVRCSS